jgi:hypothetical protein
LLTDKALKAVFSLIEKEKKQTLVEDDFKIITESIYNKPKRAMVAKFL